MSLSFLMVCCFALAGFGNGGGEIGQSAVLRNSESAKSSQSDRAEKMDELDYVEFELEVEYAGDQVYEAELERKRNNRVKAEIKDSRNGVRKEKEEAFDELFPLVQKLSITQETSKEEAIRVTLSVFDLSADYEEFELELKFKDGTKLEFNDTK